MNEIVYMACMNSWMLLARGNDKISDAKLRCRSLVLILLLLPKHCRNASDSPESILTKILSSLRMLLSCKSLESERFLCFLVVRLTLFRSFSTRTIGERPDRDMIQARHIDSPNAQQIIEQVGQHKIGRYLIHQSRSGKCLSRLVLKAFSVHRSTRVRAL